MYQNSYNPQPTINSYYGLSRRQDLPTPSAPPSPPPERVQPSRSFGQNFAVYDPVTRQRTNAFDRNCTAPGCCVPKCFAEKGSRVRNPLLYHV